MSDFLKNIFSIEMAKSYPVEFCCFWVSATSFIVIIVKIIFSLTAGQLQ